MVRQGHIEAIACREAIHVRRSQLDYEAMRGRGRQFKFCAFENRVALKTGQLWKQGNFGNRTTLETGNISV